MKKELEEKVLAYYQAKAEADKAKETADNLGKELKELLDREGITKELTSDGLEVSMVGKTTIKYNDEVAIKDYLRNNQMSDYLVEAIDNKKLNDSIKNSSTLNEALKDKITVTTTYSLSVKEKK